MSDWPESCIGPNGTGGCRFDPVFAVAGDGACIYHLIAVVRRRAVETSRLRGDYGVKPDSVLVEVKP